MTEIMGEHLLILCLFGWPKISRCVPIFRELGTSNCWAPPKSINRLDPLGESSLSSEKLVSLNFSFVVLPSRNVSFSPLYQMEKGNVERMLVESRLFESMVDAICQSLWWACRKTLAFVTWLRRRGAIARWLALIGVKIWFRVVQFLRGEDRSKGSDPLSI